MEKSSMVYERKRKRSKEAEEEKVMDDSRYLSMCIISCILSHLPIESMLKFRCVCKVWNAYLYSMLLDPLTNNNRSNQGGLVIFRQDSISYRNGEHKEVIFVKENSFEADIFIIMRVSPSINGLICIQTSDYLIHVDNPTIGKKFVLPKIHGKVSGSLIGFGFHQSIKEYKVVAMFKSRTLIFTLGKSSWRMVQNAPPRDYPVRSDPTFVNGRLYWQSNENKIVSFDVREERYDQQVITTPPELDNHNMLDLSVLLVELRNNLCMVISDCDASGCVKELKVWMMKEYSSDQNQHQRQRWVNEYRINLETLTVSPRECEIKYIVNEKILMTRKPSSTLDLQWFSYDIESGMLELVQDYNEPSRSRTMIVPYIPSLCWQV